MNDSYGYNEDERTLTKEELKEKEKEFRRQRKAKDKEDRARKRAARKEKKRGKKFLATVGLAVAFGVVASATFNATNFVTSKFSSKDDKKVEESIPETKQEETTAQSKNESEKKEAEVVKEATLMDSSINEGLGSVAQVAENAMPSIVAITCKSVQEVMTMFGTGIQQYEAESAGSGIIIGQNDNELLIVTNAHVVEGANELSVCFVNEEVNSAVVKGSDTTNDLAVLAVSLDEVSGETLETIKIAQIGNSEELVIGQQVVAIGNALGYGQSVTTGIVSALDRTISDADSDAAYIQTDAAINPGNSGGALLNMKGELIGINSAKLANTKIEGMGYAIPISKAQPIINGLMNMVTRELVDEKDAGYIGISGFSVTEEVSKQYGIPEGIYVSEVSEGAASDRAGIKKGDIIISFDGISVDSIKKLRERLDYYRAGETVELVIYRADNGEYIEKNVNITLDSRQGTPLDQSTNDNTDSEQKQQGGDIREYINPNNGMFGFFGQ